MSPDEEIAALRAQLADRDATIAAQAAVLDERDRRLALAALEIEQMRVQLTLLRRQQFGRSSEKLDTAAAQFELRLEALEEDFAADEADLASRVSTKPVGGARRSASGHRPLPAHLPRETIIHGRRSSAIVVNASNWPDWARTSRRCWRRSRRG